MEAADAAIGSSAEGVSTLKRRVEVLAYRFKGDWDALFASFGAGDEVRLTEYVAPVLLATV